MSESYKHPIIFAKVGGRKRSLGSPDQWRRAIVSQDLTRDSIVEYEPGPGRKSTERAGDIPELIPIFLKEIGEEEPEEVEEVKDLSETVDASAEEEFEADADAGLTEGDDAEDIDLEELLDQATVNFDFESAELDEEAKAALVNIVAAFHDAAQFGDDLTIWIEGHADKAETNPLVRSFDRCTTVREFLESSGIASWRIEHEVVGNGQPVIETEDAEGDRQNRRVELSIEKVESDAEGGGPGAGHGDEPHNETDNEPADQPAATVSAPVVAKAQEKPELVSSLEQPTDPVETLSDVPQPEVSEEAVAVTAPAEAEPEPEPEAETHEDAAALPPAKKSSPFKYLPFAFGGLLFVLFLTHVLSEEPADTDAIVSGDFYPIQMAEVLSDPSWNADVLGQLRPYTGTRIVRDVDGVYAEIETSDGQTAYVEWEDFGGLGGTGAPGNIRIRNTCNFERSVAFSLREDGEWNLFNFEMRAGEDRLLRSRTGIVTADGPRMYWINLGRGFHNRRSNSVEILGPRNIGINGEDRRMGIVAPVLNSNGEYEIDFCGPE